MKKTKLRRYGKSARAKLIRQNDILWSKNIRTRDKLCRKCKRAKATQAAHFFSRNNYSVRWDLRNGWGADFYCHILWAHRNPLEFSEWAKEELGKDYGLLRKKARGLSHYSMKDLEGIKKTLDF